MPENDAPRFVKPKSKNELKEWVDDVVKFAGTHLSMYNSSYVRTSSEQQLINVDLYNGILHPEDMKGLLNPLELRTIADRELKHYPRAAPLIDLLVGEEIDRPFEPLIQITNNIGIEEKDQRLRDYVEAELAELQANFKGDEVELKEEVIKLKRKLKYTYKDLKEKKLTALLNHYWHEQEMEPMFVEGFRTSLLTGTEVADICFENGEPKARLLVSAKLRTYGSGNSNIIEDSDIIVYEDHYSPGQIIEAYGDRLGPDDLETILNYRNGIGGYDKAYGDVTHEFRPMLQGGQTEEPVVVGSYMGAELNSSFIRSDGSIRVQFIKFRAFKEVKRVVFQDPATGEQQEKIVSHNYKLQEGEKTKKKFTIPEWWTAKLIGSDIVIDAQPSELLYKKINSNIESHPGTIGETFNIMERPVAPPMTRMKPYQYLFDIVMDRFIVAMSKNIGPVLEMDTAKKPNNWSTDSWIKYLYKYNLKFTNSLKEIDRGSAAGRLVGNVAQGHDQIMNFDFGQYINQLVMMLEYLEKAMADVIGISPQRKGSMSNRETFGAVERSTVQSSHTTEWFFYKHNNFKIRFLNVFLQAAVQSLEDNPRKLQLIVEKDTREMLDVVGDDFVGVEAGVFVSNSAKAQKHKQALEQATQAYMQNGGDFSFVFDVLFSDSMAEQRRLIEENESQAKQERADEAKMENQQFQKQQETLKEIEAKKEEFEKYKVDLEAALKEKKIQSDEAIALGKITSTEDMTLDELKQRIIKDNEELNIRNKELELKNRELDIKEKDVNNKNNSN